jgi:prepilin-type processing-associated H-X9-DG protein
MRMNRPVRERRGWARCDVLVLVGLVSGAVLLGLPYLQHLRAEADRTGCAARLGALSQAMLHYENTHGGLPPRRITRPFYQGFGVTLLPYLGEEQLAKAYRADRHFFDATNQAVIRTPLAAFQCPSAPGPRTVDIADMTGKALGTVGATSDYFLPNAARDSGLPEALQTNQHTALLDDRMMPHSACTDGTSQTLLIMEMAGRPDHWIAGKKQAERRQAHAGWWGAWAAWNATQVWSYTPSGRRYEGPCTVNCNNDHGLYSFHENGAHASFVDGSVRFLNTKLDRYVLFALITRDGGELVADTDY